jgi:hypothetical protein
VALPLERICLTVPDNVVARTVDGLTVLLDVDTGRSFTLDPLGSRVWTLLSTSPTAQSALETLLTEFAADPAAIRADVEALIEALTTNALLSGREI